MVRCSEASQRPKKSQSMGAAELSTGDLPRACGQVAGSFFAPRRGPVPPCGLSARGGRSLTPPRGSCPRHRTLPGSRGKRSARRREVPRGGFVIRPRDNDSKQTEKPHNGWKNTQKNDVVKQAFDDKENEVAEMIPKTVERSQIFAEFSKEESAEYFSLKSKKILPHLDNIYYTVFIKKDNSNEDTPEGVLSLLERLEECRELKSHSYEAQVPFLDHDYMRSNHAIYAHRLSRQNMYDIFIASYLPNEQTPRIEVQIRSAMLVLLGVDEAVKQSFEAVRQILWNFALSPLVCRENRIDYAYHTNAIQDPMSYFNDAELVQHLKSKLRKYQKVGEVGRKIDLSYISLGMRKSNNVFFRAYDKGREVVDQNYKDFFFQRWLENGLISAYDHYCYSYAFESKSYILGLLIGRINWYLEHGKNAELKQELLKLKDTYYRKSSNSAELADRLSGVLPEVTRIINIEFETKRKFYASFEGLFENVDLGGADVPAELRRVYQILYARQTVHDYLTKITVNFLKDRNDSKSEVCDWWRRLSGCRVSALDVQEYRRVYKRTPEEVRAGRRVMQAISYHAMVLRESTEPRSFFEDASDSLAYLNDNHFYGFACDPATGEVYDQDPRGYADLRARKAYQNKQLIKMRHELNEGQRAERAAAEAAEHRVYNEFRERQDYRASMYTSDPYGPIRRGFFPVEDDSDLPF